MDDEDISARPKPPLPYRAGPAVLRVPSEAVRATCLLLQRAGARESGVFWYGTREEGGISRVRLAVAPRQTMAKFNYHVDAEAVAEIVRNLSPAWRPLAQVHSRPGKLVEHSRYDDRMIMSKRVLSLVFPRYGNAAPAAFPVGVGVHEYQNGYWHLLDEASARARVELEEGEAQTADLRT